jgi:hypothetical protein
MRNRNGFAKFVRGLSEPHPVALSEKHPRKAKSRQPLIPEQKALRRHRGPQSCPISANRSTNHRGHAPDQFRGNLPTKTEIVTALPSYIGQRLSDIRRGWCPSRSPQRGAERVVRSDASEAHRLSLSARFLSARDRQVKAKQQQMKHFRGSPYATHQVRHQPPNPASEAGQHPEIGPHLRYYITYSEAAVHPNGADPAFRAPDTPNPRPRHHPDPQPHAA